MILKFENFQESNNLETLIEILETELEDDFEFGACRWWREEGDVDGYFRENSKNIPCKHKDNNTIIVEIENKYLYRLIDEYLKEFKTELYKSNQYSGIDVSIRDDRIKKNEFFQRIFDLSNYMIDGMFYRSNTYRNVISFYFKLHKQ